MYYPRTGFNKFGQIKLGICIASTQVLLGGSTGVEVTNASQWLMFPKWTLQTVSKCSLTVRFVVVVVIILIVILNIIHFTNILHDQPAHWLNRLWSSNDHIWFPGSDKQKNRNLNHLSTVYLCVRLSVCQSISMRAKVPRFVCLAVCLSVCLPLHVPKPKQPHLCYATLSVHPPTHFWEWVSNMH
jgi:hypothetical protein